MYKRQVLDVGADGGDPLGRTDVGLAHLQEASAGGQHPQRGIDELTGQRVQHHVHAGEGVLEVQGARRGDALLRYAERADHRPLGGSGGGPHLGAEVVRQLHGRHADAAGRRVDQQFLPRPQPGQVP